MIDAVITVDGSRIKSRENLSLTPVLESASQKEGLPSILLNGRISQKVYDREIALNNLQDEPRFLVVQAGKSESVINYKTVIPFEPWMKDARFVLIPNMCGCGKEEQGAPLVMADKVLTRPDKRYEVQPTLAYISPGSRNGKTSCRGGDCLSGLPGGKICDPAGFP